MDAGWDVADFALSTAPRALVVKVGVGALVCWLHHTVLRAVFGHSPFVALKLVSIHHTALLGPLCLFFLLRDHAPLPSLGSLLTATPDPLAPLMERRNPHAGWLVPWLCGLVVYELGLFRLWHSPTSALMVLHHLGVLVAFPVLASSQVGVGVLLYWCGVEISSPFVQARFLIELWGFKGTKWELANGLLLTATFLLVRVLPLPYIALVHAHATAFIDSQPLAVRLSCHSEVVALALNAYWGVLVVKGASRRLFERDAGDKKARSD